LGRARTNAMATSCSRIFSLRIGSPRSSSRLCAQKEIPSKSSDGREFSPRPRMRAVVYLGQLRRRQLRIALRR
jgi:hypothetical protein